MNLQKVGLKTLSKKMFQDFVRGLNRHFNRFKHYYFRIISIKKYVKIKRIANTLFPLI